MNFIFNASGVSSVASDMIFLIVFALLTVAVVLVAVWLITRFINRPKDSLMPSGQGFAALVGVILAVGAIFRLALALLIRGYRPELKLFIDAISHVNNNGIGGYYTAGGKLYPITYLLYSLIGLFTGAVGIDASTVGMQLVVKLPLIISDVLTALFLYKFAKKYINGFVGMIIAAVYMICPVFFMASGIWGSVYSFSALFIVLSLYFVSQKNYLGIFITYGVALLTVKDALYLFPLFAVYIVYNFIKAWISLSKTKYSSFKEFFTSNDGIVFKIPLYFILTTLFSYLLSLIVIYKDFGGSFFKWFFTFFLKPVGVFEKFGTNSLGIFNLFVKNFKTLGANFPSVIFAVIFAVIIFAIVILIYLSKKNRANLVLLGSFIMFTLATYFIDFGALNLVPALAVLLLSYILIRDKRILQIFALMSIFVFINSSVVMINAGFLNNASDWTLSSSNSFYSGSVELTKGVGLVMNIIMSVFMILTHLYLTMVMLDISMSNRRKTITGEDKAKFFVSVGRWFKF